MVNFSNNPFSSVKLRGSCHSDSMALSCYFSHPLASLFFSAHKPSRYHIRKWYSNILSAREKVRSAFSIISDSTKDQRTSIWHFLPNAVPSFAEFYQLFLFSITHQTQNNCRKIKCCKICSEIHLNIQLSSALVSLKPEHWNSMHDVKRKHSCNLMFTIFIATCCINEAWL